MKTGRVDVFREVVTSDSLPIHLVQQPFSEIPMSDRAKTGKSLTPMSKRIELVKRTKDVNVKFHNVPFLYQLIPSDVIQQNY